jgi:murein DD-endopeptidase MepM/ murein hydrolase activator NlpD
MIFKKYKITCPFGPRSIKVNGKVDNRNHNGIDFVAIGDTTVYSPISGKVITSQYITDKNNSLWQYGNYVCIQSADNHVHYFAHLASRYVRVGDFVQQGQSIGVMGNTGYSTGAHTHYGIKSPVSNKFINPIDYYNTVRQAQSMGSASQGNSGGLDVFGYNKLEKGIQDIMAISIEQALNQRLKK